MAFSLQGDIPVSGANAYVSVAAFRSYWSDRGVDVSTYDDGAVQVAIVKGTQYLDLRFEYVGQRVDRLQDLEWPRQFAFNDRGDYITGLPTAVQQATCEYAYRALSATLMPDPVVSDTGLTIKSKKETVGPVTEEYEFDTRAGGGAALPDYTLADRILIARGLVSSGASTGQTGGLMSGDIARS